MSDEEQELDWSEQDLSEMDDETLIEYMNERPKDFLGHVARQIRSEVLEDVFGPGPGYQDERLTDTAKHGGRLEAMAKRSRDRFPEHQSKWGLGLGSDLIPTTLDED